MRGMGLCMSAEGRSDIGRAILQLDDFSSLLLVGGLEVVGVADQRVWALVVHLIDYTEGETNSSSLHSENQIKWKKESGIGMRGPGSGQGRGSLCGRI